MLNRQSTFHQNLKNRKGQVALFIALIFQILFLFFAMVINVGLLVHHKINLQNSVDLAAYYGAMKQAEGMNVIAHTNYQIRQSWKLLTWRYRMLGSAGDFTEHPFSKYTKGLQGGDDDGINMASEAFYNAPAFCITYVPFKPMPPDENTCKDLTQYSGIKVFDVPPVIIDLPGISNSVRSYSQRMRNLAFQRCKDFGSFNYKVLGSFVVAFNIDQANRMQFINYMAGAMSPNSPTADFYDIDGQSVKGGMQKTFENNLTSANRSAVTKFDTYNSLGDSSCNRSGIPNGAPPKWLVPIKVAPGFVYVDTTCNAKIAPQRKILYKDKTNWPEHACDSDAKFCDDIKELAPFIRMAEPPLEDPYNFSVGVEKSPYCMAYVGVSASTQPKIPFSPFGAVTLKARAFYKPFGGRIGPWYNKRWSSKQVPSRGSDQGDRSSRTDPNLPPRVYDPGNMGDQTDPSRAANYSRFIGDQWGLKSRRVLFQYGQAIYKLDATWNGAGSVAGNEINWGDEAPSFDHWAHLPFNFYQKGGSQDLLAWNSAKNEPSRMRELELSGILPDPFDLAYYSIQPNFYQTYYTRIRDGFLKGVGSGYYTQGQTGQKEFLGDIGTHKGAGTVNGVNYDEFSVKDQYAVVNKSAHVKQFIDFQQKLTYVSTKWEQVLTGWAPQSLLDYSLDSKRFGDCTEYPEGVSKSSPYNPTRVPTSGNCVVGGSAGYSVKMISSDYLRSEISNIGGEGVNGTILNQPPGDDEF